MYIRKFKDILKTENINDIIEYYDIEVKDNKKKVESIIEELCNRFREFFNNQYSFEFEEIIENIRNNGNSYTDIENILIDNGFLYLEDDKTYIPEEIYNIKEELFNKDKKIELLVSIIKLYLFINIIIPKEFIETNYIKRYNLDIDISDIKDSDGIYIKDNYFMLSNDIDIENYSKILNNECDYRILDYYELVEYFDRYVSLREKVVDILGKNNVNDVLLAFYLKPYDNPEAIFRDILRHFNLVEHLNEILKLYDENVNSFRFSVFKGRNMEELLLDRLIKDIEEVKDIKDFTLNNIVNNEKFVYKGNYDEVYNEMLEDFRDYCDFDIDEIEAYLEDEVNYDTFNVKDNIKYYIGVVKCNNKYKYVIPNELRELINKREKITKSLKDRFNDKYIDLINVIDSYININGIINKNKLVELINKSGYNITLEDIDNISKYMFFDYNIDNDIIYYKSIYKGNVDTYMENKIDVYKVIDNIDNLFNLKEYLYNTFEEYDIYDDIFIEDLYAVICMSCMTKKELNGILKHYNIVLSNKNICDIYNKIKNVFDDVPLWFNNGYSNNELRNF